MILSWFAASGIQRSDPLEGSVTSGYDSPTYRPHIGERFYQGPG